MELNREKIIKALKCCSDDNTCYKGDCPYKSDFVTACTTDMSKDALALIKELTEENERLRVVSDKQKLWENVLKAEAQEVPIKAERIRVADAITDEIYARYRQRECFDGGTWNCDKFKALLEDIRAKYISEEKWEDRDC